MLRLGTEDELIIPAQLAPEIQISSLSEETGLAQGTAVQFSSFLFQILLPEPKFRQLLCCQSHVQKSTSGLV